MTPLRRLAAPTLLGALALLAGCRHDGRDLGPPNANDRSIMPTSTSTEGTLAFDSAVEDGAGDTLPGEDLGADDQGGDVESLGMYIEVPWETDTEIPVRFTCAGTNVSPEIRWYELPEGTVEVAIVLSDLETEGYVHWVIAGLDPAPGFIGEGQVPLGAIQATNSQGKVGYTGPCPPAGSTHSYDIEVMALDQQIELPDGTDAESLIQAIGAATIESASDSGIVSR